MKFGIHYSQALGLDPTVDDYIEVAQFIESLGFSSLWLGDHIVIPKTIEASYPYTSDGSIGFHPATPWPDPFIMLTAIAMATRSLRLATGITVLPYRNPIQVAKSVATLDQIARGRFLFGVGVGWLAEEYAALNVPFEDRGARANEYLEIIIAMWKDKIADFKGRYYTIPDLHINPQPYQKPHPPIIVGGQSGRAFKRIVAFGDGWQSGPVSLALFREELAQLGADMERAGRKIEDLRLFKVVTPDFLLDNLHEISAHEQLGVEEMVLLLNCDSRQEAEAQIRRAASILLR